jgi:uncharacterized Zn-binding protein involved in type VI secretion
MTDTTLHPGRATGAIAEGDASVLVEGLPAAVLGSNHVCAWVPPPPHPSSTPMVGGSASVTIGGKPAIRVGDSAGCGATVVAGATQTVIGD